MFASINLSTGQNSGGSEDGDGKHAKQGPVREDSTARKCPDDGVQLSKGPVRQDSTARKSLDGDGGGNEGRRDRLSKSLNCSGGVPLKKGPVRHSSTTGWSFDAPNVRTLAYGGIGNAVRTRENIAISVV